MKSLNMDNKAWMILNEDEKQAIKLNLGLQKSTWAASEIMGKSHYKYLEILERAKSIFKIFSEYFDLYNDALIPMDIEVEEDFERYIESVILDRMKVREATNDLKDKDLRKPENRDLMLVKNMQYLRSLNSINANNLFDLIKNFDRYNNFRVLPAAIQEPHAFKRRNKKRIKKYIENLLQLDDFIITSIIQRYSLKRPKGDSLYFALPQKNRLELSRIIIIKRDEVIIKRFTDAGLFLFPVPDYAKEFLEIVTDYFGKDIKHCKEGQIFWPRLREIIKNAINYDEIENLIPGRKYLPEATKNLDRSIVRNYKNNLNKTKNIYFDN